MTEDRRLERARRLLALPTGWLEAAGPRTYALRTGGDRRARIMMRLDEADFIALTEAPGLRTRPGGGWVARAAAPAALPAPAPGRPGHAGGLRPVIQSDGVIVERAANLATSPVAWLAGRTDARGRPLLSKAESAAAGRLALEAEAARRGPGLTMRWDGLPRAGRGGGRPGAPGDRVLSAARRVEAALLACGPARAMVEQICLRGAPLQAAERTLGLRRRTGKTVLRQGLAALARHYRLT